MTVESFTAEQHGVAVATMIATIREFESRMPLLAEEGLIRGSTHPSVGMEAVAVGVSQALSAGDSIASNHRGHAHVLARGADPDRVMAEILGRRDGFGGGKGGSMHIGVGELGILGTNGIVGAGIGLATGAALASSVLSQDSVSVVYFGDGAINQGVLAEAMNLAAVWSLPVVFVCENNQYAQSTSIEHTTAEKQLSLRGPALGVPSVDVDGMKVDEVFDAAAEAVGRARGGAGPTLIVADTYRYLGHMAGDTEIYRDVAEVEEWKSRDPLAYAVDLILSDGVVSDDAWRRIQSEVESRVAKAEQFARNSPYPDVKESVTDVYNMEGAY